MKKEEKRKEKKRRGEKRNAENGLIRWMIK